MYLDHSFVSKFFKEIKVIIVLNFCFWSCQRQNVLNLFLFCINFSVVVLIKFVFIKKTVLLRLSFFFTIGWGFCIILRFWSGLLNEHSWRNLPSFLNVLFVTWNYSNCFSKSVVCKMLILNNYNSLCSV